MTYRITLTEKQAELLTRACDCYARLLMGQFGFVADHAMKELDDIDRSLEFRDAMERLGPLLTGLPLHASKGIFHPELHEDAKMAHDIQSVITHRISWDRNPGGGFGVNFYEPMQAASEPLPVIEGAT